MSKVPKLMLFLIACLINSLFLFLYSPKIYTFNLSGVYEDINELFTFVEVMDGRDAIPNDTLYEKNPQTATALVASETIISESAAATTTLTRKGEKEKLPWITKAMTNETTIILVMSARAHTERRQVIRETWASGHNNVYFIVGAACPYPKSQMNFDSPKCEQQHPERGNMLKHQEFIRKEDSELLMEQQRYGDMIYTPKWESYHGLVHKLKEGYEWVISKTEADWIVKVDDDTVVRVNSLARYLIQRSTSISPRTTPMVIGRIIRNSPVQKEGKWKEHWKYAQHHDKYPLWAQGSCGHIVSRSVATFITRHKENLYDYQGEDTSMAIWIDESSLKNKVIWHHSKAFVNEGDCFHPKFLIIGHQIKPSKMRKCYESLDEVDNIPITR